MNEKLYFNRKRNNEAITSLSSSDLKNYNGGGWITEGIAWLMGAWDVHSSRIQMTPAEREAFIKEHGLRDHW